MRYVIYAFGILLLSHNALSSDDQNRAFGTRRSESFRVEKGDRLDLNTKGGDIIISTWKKDEAVVNVEGFRSDSSNDLRIRYEGGVLRVDYEPRFPLWSVIRRKGLRFKIDLPQKFDLELRTGGGEIEVLGDLAGRLRGSTSRGDITLGNVDGEVDVTTSGGDIRTGTIGGEGYLHSSGGEIRVEKALADLDVQTSGGDIRVGHVGDTLEAQTSGGDITIAYIGGKARISTSGGDIEIGELDGDARITTAGGDIDLGNAKGFIGVKTAGGDMELMSIRGAIDAKSDGGDIFAEISPVGSRRSSLITAGGDIVLYVDPKARTSIEARIQVKDPSVPPGYQYNGLQTFQVPPSGVPSDPGIIIPQMDTEKDRRAIEEARRIMEEKRRKMEEVRHQMEEIRREMEEVRREMMAKQIGARALSGSFSGSSLSYEIQSSFEAENNSVDIEKGEISATYVLNGGGGQIWLETSNGNIEIRELSTR